MSNKYIIYYLMHSRRLYVSGVIRGIKQQIIVVDSTGLVTKAYTFDTESDAFDARAELEAAMDHEYYVDTVICEDDDERPSFEWSKGSVHRATNRIIYGNNE